MNWDNLLLGKENWEFLIMVIIRTVAMFTIILLGLRLLGKRSINQLSVFELGVVIGLGSAAGDPMFYKSVGLLHGMLVFTIVIIMYKLTTWLIRKNNKMEIFLEGRAAVLINDGMFIIDELKKVPLTKDEIYENLRSRSVYQLGQVRQAILETSGLLSVYFYEDKEVKYGLPIILHIDKSIVHRIPETGHYSCFYCGGTSEFQVNESPVCIYCGKKEWVKSANNKRIS